MAYLGATPKGQKQSRLESYLAPLQTAKDKLSDDETPLEVEMPPIDPAFDYLKGYFFEMGQVSKLGTGISTITWQELKAFREENELDLTIWERGVLHAMSEAYVNEYYKASDPQHPAPWKPDVEEIDPEAELRKALAWRLAIRSNAKK